MYFIVACLQLLLTPLARASSRAVNVMCVRFQVGSIRHDAFGSIVGSVFCVCRQFRALFPPVSMIVERVATATNASYYNPSKLKKLVNPAHVWFDFY